MIEDESAGPYALFDLWFEAAQRSEVNDPNAMALATSTGTGAPSVRMVLLKGVDPDATQDRGFVFYSNTDSRKGQELRANDRVALLFHWKSLRRQIRIEGAARPVGPDEADGYFATRPRLSRLGAWASDQSRPLDSRATLEARLAALERQYPGDAIPRPPYWSGWRVLPEAFEFWQDRPFRLHDRLVFAREPDGWRGSRLYP